jgi:hypothetical protein
MADFTRIIGIRIVALHQPDGMTEEAELHEPEVKREDRRGDDQPHDDPRKRRSGKWCKDEVDERAGDIGEDVVDLLVDGHGFLGIGGGRHACRCNRQQHDFLEVHHDWILS